MHTADLYTRRGRARVPFETDDADGRRDEPLPPDRLRDLLIALAVLFALSGLAWGAFLRDQPTGSHPAPRQARGAHDR